MTSSQVSVKWRETTANRDKIRFGGLQDERDLLLGLHLRLLSVIGGVLGLLDFGLRGLLILSLTGLLLGIGFSLLFCLSFGLVGLEFGLHHLLAEVLHVQVGLSLLLQLLDLIFKK